MAGLAPFFITGANAKIKLNGVTLAYCTGLSYQVIVNHATPTVLGMYEPSSIEPLSYKVSGTFEVVRYANNVKEQLKALGYATPSGVNPNGNGVGNFSSAAGDAVATAFGDDGRAHENFDPSKLSTGTFFDIEIYQKMPKDTELRGIGKIRSCRLTAMSGNITKKSPLVEQFQFQALYFDGDSFNADFSGSGQQFD